MNNLSQDLIYECLFFLDWKEYYRVCKKMNIALRLNVYFKYHELLDFDEVCNKSEEYLEILHYLHSINASIDNWPITISIYRGHLNTLKFLHSINAPRASNINEWVYVYEDRYPDIATYYRKYMK